MSQSVAVRYCSQSCCQMKSYFLQFYIENLTYFAKCSLCAELLEQIGLLTCTINATHYRQKFFVTRANRCFNLVVCKADDIELDIFNSTTKLMKCFMIMCNTGCFFFQFSVTLDDFSILTNEVYRLLTVFVS